MSPYGWLLCLVAAFTGSAWALRYARREQVLDHPGERSNHRLPTPRGGGIAMVAVMAGVLAWLALANPGQRFVLLAMLAGLVLVGGAGWLDDHRPLAARVRLAVHVLAAALVAGSMVASGWPGWCAALALVAIPALVNIWNFMDGIDGIAASQALAWGLALAVWAPATVAGGMGLGLAMACLGFLPFNFPRAKVFMGDVGSGALGFLVAASALWLARERGTNALAGLFVLAPFLVDAGLTLARRVWRRERWWQAHSQHAYQGLARAWRGHVAVSVLYFVLAASGAVVGQLLTFQETGITISLMLLWYIAMAALWRSAQFRAKFRGEPFGDVA